MLRIDDGVPKASLNELPQSHWVLSIQTSDEPQLILHSYNRHTMLSAKCIWGDPRNIMLLLKLLNSHNINRCSQLFYPILWGEKLFIDCVIKVKQKKKEDRTWESKSKMSR